MNTLRLGTRRSPLAMAQSAAVAARLETVTGTRVDLVEVSTAGDESSAPLTSFGGAGVFVSRLRQALTEGRVDLAVHSLKDLPTAPAPDLALAAVPVREDPRDVLVSRAGRGLAGLPSGARVGTGSPRRAAQLRAVRTDLDVVDLRGNVDTRLARVDGDGEHPGDLDAVVLARAGLLRLGRPERAGEVLDAEVMLPAPGQGALAVECRQGDGELIAMLRALDDADTRAAVRAERTLLATVEAGCAAPLGALATGAGPGRLRLRALVAAEDGSRVLRRTATGPIADPDALALGLAAELLADGAADLLATARAATRSIRREGAS